MATTPETASLAAFTQRPPGPTIRSTAGTDSVPHVMAATAWAPPAANTASTPARAAAASTGGAGSPSAPGGEHTITSRQPASRAGTAAMSRLEG